MLYYVLLCCILMIDQNRQYVSNNFIFTCQESNINLSGRSRGGLPLGTFYALAYHPVIAVCPISHTKGPPSLGKSWICDLIQTSKHSWEYYLYSTGAVVIYIAVMQRLGSGYEFTCDCKGWAVGMNSHVTAKAGQWV